MFAAVAIGSAGLSKLITTGEWDRLFASWGYPAWFMIVVACAELFGAIALLVPRFAVVGAAVLGAVMLGAAGTLFTHPGTHFFRGRQAPMTATTPIIWFVLLSVIAVVRWRKLYR
ncbi:MAG TPA: DoxX family protein [Gemmatimonadaceae bacterium]|nr:DoxX family protein [Gemmatimonadaceae bacterium]